MYSQRIMGKKNSCETLNLSLPGWDAAKEKKQSFENNLDHLKFLEYEVMAQIAISFKHVPGIKESLDKNMIKISPEIIGGTSDVSAVPNMLFNQHLSEIKKKNRQRESASQKAGIKLNLLDVCQAYNLDKTEREIVLLLFLKNTSQSFRKLTDELEPESLSWGDSGMSVGLVLNLLSSNFVEQLINRKYFSIDASLIRQEVIVGNNDLYDDRSSILDERFYLHQRITNFIIGDNNAYSFDLNCISKVDIRVDIDQVVLEKDLKQEIINSVEDYLKLSSEKREFQLKDFYGYGTGLTFLFHGPSGTGKTMMAYALAQKTGKDLLNLNLGEMQQQKHSMDDLIKYAFKEAKLSDSILFFDECDDLFEENSHESMALLTEIEKAECITIMATNKVIRLDPSMDRRITMKIPFSIPGKKEREQIWKVLIPPTAEIDENIDFKELAQKYIFTGGLIKNTILVALSKAVSNTEDNQIRLTLPVIKNAADYQAKNLFHQENFGTVYEPTSNIDDLILGMKDRKSLKTLAEHTERLNHEKAGSCILIASDDISTGINAVDGIAAACDRHIRRFSLSEAYNGPKDRLLKNPLTHAEVEPFDFVFSSLPGHRSLTVIVDFDGVLELHQDGNQVETMMVSGLIQRLRKLDSVVYVVSRLWKNDLLPPEINHMMKLSHPPEELQIRRWIHHLKEYGVDEDAIIDIVENHSMHIKEIDYYVRQANLSSILKYGDQSQTKNQIESVINQYKKTIPILFGREKNAEGS